MSKLFIFFTVFISTLIGLLFFSDIASAKVTFTVQVASKPEAESAKKMVQSFKAKGMDAFYVVAEVPGAGTRYRVGLGHFPSRLRAIQYQKELAKGGSLPHGSFVTKVEGKEPEVESVTGAVTPQKDVVSTDLQTTPDPNLSAKVEALVPVTPPAEVVQKPSTPIPPPVTIPIAPAAPATNSSWSLNFSLVADTTSYSLNFPTNYGGVTLTNANSATLIGTGAAVLPTYWLSPDFELETGLIYFQRSFNVVYNNGTSLQTGSETYTAFEIPLMLNYWFSKHFGMGIGVYDIINPAGPINQSNSALPDSSLTGNDYGVTGSIKYAMKLGAETDFLLNARYNYGSGNMVPAGSYPQQVFSDIQLLAGIRQAL